MTTGVSRSWHFRGIGDVSLGKTPIAPRERGAYGGQSRDRLGSLKAPTELGALWASLPELHGTPLDDGRLSLSPLEPSWVNSGLDSSYAKLAPPTYAAGIYRGREARLPRERAEAALAELLEGYPSALGWELSRSITVVANGPSLIIEWPIETEGKRGWLEFARTRS